MARLSVHRIRRLEYAAVASAFIFIAILVAVAAMAGFGKILAYFRLVGLPTVGLLLTLSLFNYLCRALRWRLFSRRLGLALGLGETVLCYFAGFAMTTTPGKLGEAVRVWLIGRRHRYGYARTMPMLIGDRLGDLYALLLLTGIGTTAAPGHILPLLLMLLIAAALGCVFARPQASITLLNGIYGRLRRAPRLFAAARRTARLSALILGSRVAVPALLLGVLGWFAECAACHVVLTAMGSPLAFSQSIFVFSFSMLVGGLSMMPGGLGGTEASMVGLLIAAGVDFHAAIAATAIIRVTTLWFAVGLGIPSLALALRAARPADGRASVVAVQAP